MKLGSLFFIILVIAFGFTAMALIVGDLKTYYPEAGDVAADYETNYSYQNDVNSSFAGVQKKLEDLASDESSGWKKFLSGAVVVPMAAIAVISQVIKALPNLISMMSNASKTLGINPVITEIAIIALIGAAIIMLVRFIYKPTVT